MDTGVMKYVASCSFGKDSLATILLALMHNEPLDEVVYCEVMFDAGVSGEVPEHRDFIYLPGKFLPHPEKRPGGRKNQFLAALWEMLHPAGL